MWRDQCVGRKSAHGACTHRCGRGRTHGSGGIRARCAAPLGPRCPCSPTCAMVTSHFCAYVRMQPCRSLTTVCQSGRWRSHVQMSLCRVVSSGHWPQARASVSIRNIGPSADLRQAAGPCPRVLLMLDGRCARMCVERTGESLCRPAMPTDCCFVCNGFLIPPLTRCRSCAALLKSVRCQTS